MTFVSSSAVAVAVAPWSPTSADHAATSPGPVIANFSFDPYFRTQLAQQIQFFLGIGIELVDRHHYRYTELACVFDMPREVVETLDHRAYVLTLDLILAAAAVQLERPGGAHDHRRIGLETRFAHLDVKEFFRTRSAPKPASVTT